MPIGHWIPSNGKDETDPEYEPKWLVCECGEECVKEIKESIVYQLDRREHQSEVDSFGDPEWCWWCNECRQQVTEPWELSRTF